MKHSFLYKVIHLYKSGGGYLIIFGRMLVILINAVAQENKG